MKKAVFVLLMALPALGDEVVLKNGHRIEGVVREEAGKVIVEVDAGIITLDPDHEDARRALGFRKHENRWMNEDEHLVALGFVRHNREWLKKETVEKILEQENLLQREREANATLERIATLEAEVKRMEIAAQEERDRLMAEVMRNQPVRILVASTAHFHSVSGAVRPCYCVHAPNEKKKY